ncbi:LacI family DNA-binding transcriptional regulator [Dactylosporangium sp. AC04546]|uniref:LacI family DNA-binding transcriptional regulator n=1 Tax=Dactylosporangium sp. AC04546 TaxID=2862460 RepID=UPI001EDFA7AE|nr:LacI family DNA-binding transcriptional regulator [Dactylosporangium sp. AC04546]WVK78489.1 LacI family DNA-binding transcriptional regulator [Dactylosporangium sp. AC04546]
MATIYEVAALAGVSPATVSRVMNGMSVSPERSKRVRDAAEALAFRPNRVARTLRRQHSEVIALVIPDIENPFFTSMARGVEDVAQAAGYSVLLCNTDEDHDKEARYLDIAVGANIAGVVIAAAGDRSDVSVLIDRGRPVVAVDRGPHGFDIDAVTVDNRAGGRAAAKALFDQGFRRIACITGPRDVETATQRADGWADALAANGGADEKLLRYANFRIDGGEQAMTELLELPEPPDAVFVANNLMSVGALQVLSQRGLLPPAMGMAMFGDLPFMPLAPLPITVVQLPARLIGTTAASLLLERIGGDDQPARTIVLRNRLVQH